MNIYFVVSAILLFIVSLFHSILGEKRTIGPLVNSDLLDSIYKDKRINWRKKLRRGWHLTTIAWWSIGVVIIDLARMKNPSPLSVNAIAIPFAIIGITGIVRSKGKHPSGLLLFVSMLLWAGLYL
ncbi:MAG: hypothetical protein JXL81_04595 [Deltaproteobacteria bacterium]|nr:hypothetical protein [Deltaproteobacteria bacterium]